MGVGKNPPTSEQSYQNTLSQRNGSILHGIWDKIYRIVEQLIFLLAFLFIQKCLIHKHPFQLYSTKGSTQLNRTAQYST